MKHGIKIHVIKVVSLAAMLMVTGQAICSAPVVGKDIPKLMELLEKRKTDLKSKIIIPKADLSNANLVGADLKNSYLVYANLQGTNLKGANLRGSMISWGNLTNADLTNADLTHTDLPLAKFFSVDNQGNKIYGAKVTGANFASAKGLDAATKDYLRKNGALNVRN